MKKKKLRTRAEAREWLQAQGLTAAAWEDGMSRERELEKFVKEAFVNGFLVGSENGAARDDMKERLNAARYGANRYWQISFVPMFREYRKLMDQCLKEAKNKKGGTRQFRQNQSR